MNTAPKSLSETQDLIVGLNGTDKPYIITMDGNKIIGTWNIVDANWVGLASANHLDKNYRITFDLDELKHEYGYNEVYGSKDGGISSGGLSSEGSFFSGKGFKFEKGVGIGVGVNKAESPDKIVAPVSYTFNNSDIKKPILNALEEAGWKKKKSFFGKLFS